MGDLADVRDGTHDSPKYYLTGYPLVTSKNLTDAGLDMSNVSLISAEDFERINKRSKVDIGDIIFGMIGTIGNPVLVDRCDFAIKNVALIKNSENIQNSLLLQLLKSPIFRKYVQNENVGNTQKFLGLNKIRDYNFLIPASTEQIVIGNFFRALDDTITLHQRKLDGLKELKRGYLQQLFPQTGECVPRVRFDGFSEPWQERKLDEVAEFSKGNGYSKSDLIDKGTPIILYGRLYTNYETVIKNVNTFTKMKANSILSQGGEVIVPSSGETAEDISCASVVGDEGVILGSDLNIIMPDSKIHSTFLAIAISNGTQQKELSKRAQGKSIVHISNSDLKEVVLQFPSLPEQTAISNFFRTFDGQIAAQEQKLSYLKQLKSAYLQKMLV